MSAIFRNSSDNGSLIGQLSVTMVIFGSFWSLNMALKDKSHIRYLILGQKIFFKILFRNFNELFQKHFWQKHFFPKPSFDMSENLSDFLPSDMSLV